LTDKQKWIGYTDVKSAPVHFYVQRNSPFDIFGTPIPFDLARVNDGNRQRHGFDVGEIHGTVIGNLFLLLHETSALSSFII
jgi:hypothetical protein